MPLDDLSGHSLMLGGQLDKKGVHRGLEFGHPPLGYEL